MVHGVKSAMRGGHHVRHASNVLRHHKAVAWEGHVHARLLIGVRLPWVENGIRRIPMIRRDLGLNHAGYGKRESKHRLLSKMSGIGEDGAGR